MPPAPKPLDEALRLASLASCGILDTPPDPRFDRLIDLAADHFDVPIALVSLVDADRQWFKAHRGMLRSEGPRSQAFCAYTILQRDAVLVVEDARLDPRFADHPMVQADPPLRFYAGAPILAEDGQPVGTLCLVDHKPRHLDAAGRRFLANLAASASAMLELHRKNALLQEVAACDPLTGLPNRRSFDLALSNAADLSLAGVPFGLICLDLDQFKLINDTRGHAAGDSLLPEVGRRLQAAMRATDLVARLGGDEFAVIVAGPVDLDGVRAVARKLLAAFATGTPDGRSSMAIPCSLGLALAPVHGTNPAGLLRAADQALYRAKRAGGATFAVATHDPNPSADILAPMEAALQQAIASDGLELVWQPYYSARTGKVEGCEALVRWNRPGFGAVPPSEFIARAEKAGLSSPLDRWVLLRACTVAASWAEPVSVSVNISADWFTQGDLVGLVADVLASTGLAPGRLVLELTERTLVDQPEAARAVLAALRGLGVCSALDDFGTGYSALGYLYSFHFDKLKLDRSFVEGLGHNTRAGAVCRAVLELGHALGAPVCAEGVETVAQLRFLREAGCDLLQGFLLARPQPNPGREIPAALAALVRADPPGRTWPQSAANSE